MEQWDVIFFFFFLKKIFIQIKDFFVDYKVENCWKCDL